MLGRFHQSGQSVGEFSAAEGVAGSSLYKWLRQKRRGKARPRLVEVRAPIVPEAGFSMLTPRGYRITVPEHFSEEGLKRLLGVLAS
jgi:hypothetical protein